MKLIDIVNVKRLVVIMGEDGSNKVIDKMNYNIQVDSLLLALKHFGKFAPPIGG